PTHVSIYGGSNGTITTTTTGGVGGNTYTWSDGPATTANRTGMIAGTYTVTVTDANGATANATIIVTEPPQLLVSGIVTNVTIFGLSNGIVDITPTGGVGPYTYSWSNSATTQDLNGVPAGTYTVTITDANGATVTRAFTVTQPAQLNITGVPTHV